MDKKGKEEKQVRQEATEAKGASEEKKEETQAPVCDMKELEETKARLDETSKALEAANAKIVALQQFAADTDNARKRALAETEIEVARTKESFLKELLPTLDEFDLAVQSAESDTSKDFDKMLEGIEMVKKNMFRRLADKYQLVKMEPVGDAFDPLQHEAFLMEKSDKYDHETVVQSLVTGYKLGNKVLRAAKVKVGKPNN